MQKVLNTGKLAANIANDYGNFNFNYVNITESERDNANFQRFYSTFTYSTADLNLHKLSDTKKEALYTAINNAVILDKALMTSLLNNVFIQIAHAILTNPEIPSYSAEDGTKMPSAARGSSKELVFWHQSPLHLHIELFEEYAQVELTCYCTLEEQINA